MFIKDKLYNNDPYFHVGSQTLLHHQLLNTSYDMRTAIMKIKRQNYSSSNMDGGLQTEIFNELEVTQMNAEYINK